MSNSKQQPHPGVFIEVHSSMCQYNVVRIVVTTRTVSRKQQCRSGDQIWSGQSFTSMLTSGGSSEVGWLLLHMASHPHPTSMEYRCFLLQGHDMIFSQRNQKKRLGRMRVMQHHLGQRLGPTNIKFIRGLEYTHWFKILKQLKQMTMAVVVRAKASNESTA